MSPLLPTLVVGLPARRARTAPEPPPTPSEAVVATCSATEVRLCGWLTGLSGPETPRKSPSRLVGGQAWRKAAEIATAPTKSDRTPPPQHRQRPKPPSSHQRRRKRGGLRRRLEKIDVSSAFARFCFSRFSRGSFAPFSPESPVPGSHS